MHNSSSHDQCNSGKAVVGQRKSSVQRKETNTIDMAEEGRPLLQRDLCADEAHHHHLKYDAIEENDEDKVMMDDTELALNNSSNHSNNIVRFQSFREVILMPRLSDDDASITTSDRLRWSRILIIFVCFAICLLIIRIITHPAIIPVAFFSGY
jgi:hypothetical protein